jgi:hypothetical protein
MGAVTLTTSTLIATIRWLLSPERGAELVVIAVTD